MSGRTIAITGAFGVLGQAVAQGAASQGMQLALIDIAPSGPAPEGAFVQGGVDLTDAEQAKAAFAAVGERLGGLDVLVNVAGGFVWQTVEEGDPAAFDRLFALNTKTCLNATRGALPLIRGSAAGRIVNVGANGGVKAAPGMAAYAASKSGVHRLTEALAEELKETGVTVNAVLPSIIDTPANRADMPRADFDAWVKPQELAAVILFLASETASAVTGALIPVIGRV